MTPADLAALERLLADRATIAQLQHEAADYATRMDKWRARYGEAAAELAALRAEVERMRAVVEAARVLLGTLNADEAGLYKAVDVADEVGCSNLGGTSFEEHPDVDGAMEQMTAALDALDGKEGTE